MIAGSAVEQKRNMAVLLFDRQVKQEFWLYQHGKGNDLNQALQMIGSSFNGGGTAFGPPLERAISIIKDESLFQEADIIFITDGESELSEKEQSTLDGELHSSQTSLYSLILGSTCPSLASISDSTWNLSKFSLKGAVQIQELFERV